MAYREVRMMDMEQVVGRISMRPNSDTVNIDNKSSKPMYKLAAEYSLSGPGFAKACKAASIPVRERGYWNKLQAGKSVCKRRLPLRGLGQSNQVTIGRKSCWYSEHESEEEIRSKPIAPHPFSNPIWTPCAHRSQPWSGRRRCPSEILAGSTR